MASLARQKQPHFVLIPLMAQGHMMPMVDMARLIAERGVMVSLVTTPFNASRFDMTISRAKESGLPIDLVQIPFPCQEVGLPIGCENLDSLPSKTLILSHPAIGGFLTHCGWNSALEGICAGLPLITWPLFGDQFLNEKLVEQILKIAVRVGIEDPMKWGEEEKIGVLVKKENVKVAVEKLMDGEESEARRERARELGEMARRAVEEGGSSHLYITLLIQDIMQQGDNGSETN